MEYDIIRIQNIVDKIYWKKCIGQDPLINIQFKPNLDIYDMPVNPVDVGWGYHYPTSDVEKNMAEKVKNYIENVKVDDYITMTGLLNALQKGDIPVNGLNTFFPLANGPMNGIGPGNATIYPANLRHFKYLSTAYRFIYETNNGELVGTLTIQRW